MREERRVARVDLDEARAGRTRLADLPARLDGSILRCRDHDVVLAQTRGDRIEPRLAAELRERPVRLCPRAVRVQARRARVGIGPVAPVELVAQEPAEGRVERVGARRPRRKEAGEGDATSRLDVRDDLRAERVADDDRVRMRPDERRTALDAQPRLVAGQVRSLDPVPASLELSRYLPPAPGAVPRTVDEHEGGHRPSMTAPPKRTCPGDSPQDMSARDPLRSRRGRYVQSADARGRPGRARAAVSRT